MRERKQGWIVNISSGAAFHPKPPYDAGAGRGGTVYGMCKAALERFTTGLAAEVYADGIAVNVVSPGLVATPGVAVHGLINEAHPGPRAADRVHRRGRLSAGLGRSEDADRPHRPRRAVPEGDELEARRRWSEAAMKFLSYSAGGEASFGLAAETGVIDLKSRLGVASLKALHRRRRARARRPSAGDDGGPRLARHRVRAGHPRSGQDHLHRHQLRGTPRRDRAAGGGAPDGLHPLRRHPGRPRAADRAAAGVRRASTTRASWPW